MRLRLTDMACHKVCDSFASVIPPAIACVTRGRCFFLKAGFICGMDKSEPLISVNHDCLLPTTTLQSFPAIGQATQATRL